MSFQIGFTVTAVIVVIQIVKQLQRLKRATPIWLTCRFRKV